MKPRHDGWTRCVSLAALVAMAWGLAAGVVLGETTGDVTWSGGAGSGNPYWNDTGNWIGGLYPNNPTTGKVIYDKYGQATVGKLETDRTIGGIDNGVGWNAWSAGQSHTLDLNGYRLTIAGHLQNDTGGATRTLTFTNGTVQIGTDSVQGDMQLNGVYGGNVAVIFKPGSTLDSYRMGTLRIGSTANGSNRGSMWLDLRGATVARGDLAVQNLYLCGGYVGRFGILYLDNATSLSTISISNEVIIGQTAYQGPSTTYIGNPSDAQRLPTGISVRVGTSPSQRATQFLIGTGATTAHLTAAGAGAFTAYVTDFIVGNPTYSGTLDIRAMTNCTIDATTFTVCKESGTPSATPKAAVRLCAGTVTAGTVALGSTVSGGYGLLEMSNTLFGVTGSYTINTTATNLISLGGTPSGLDVSGTLVDAGGHIAVNFLQAPSVATNWAIRIAGDAQSVLNGMIGANPSRLTYTGSYAGKKAGVLYDGTYTYFAMADTNAFSTLPIAVAHDERTYEYASGYPVTVGTNDINNGSSDPGSRPLTMTIYTNGGAESATLMFDATGDYGVTLKVTAESDSATDDCTVHVVDVHPGVTSDLTWNGGASTYEMDRPEWMWSGNWLEGVPPTNPTTATIYYKTAGQAVVGKIEAPRTVGGISVGESGQGAVTHTLNLGGTVLTVAGNISYSWLATPTLALTNGTLRIGSASVEGGLMVGDSSYGGAALVCRAGTIIDTRRVGTIRAGTATGGSNAQYGRVDLRNATIAGGVLRARNIVIGARHPSYIALDDTTTISGIAVSNSLLVGETGYGGLGYIGNPADPGYRMPANVNLQAGSGAASRGSIQIGSGGGNQPLTATLAASSGGAFTAWLTDLKVMPAGNPNPGIGTLDLAGMTNCNVDVNNIYVATGGTGVDLRGTLALPPGKVTAGTVEIGASNGAANAFGRLVTSNTLVTVTNTLTIRATGQVTNLVRTTSSGFDITNADPGALSVEDGATVTIRFLSPSAASPHYGLRWAGDHVTALQSMRSAGKLVVDDAGLGKSAAIYLQSGDSYVGLAPPAGTLITIR